MWDTIENNKNFEMHGITFEKAVTVLLDPNACELFLLFSYSGGRKMSKKTTTVLSVPELLARKSVKSTSRKIKDSEIDYSDIPEFTGEQLSKFKRRGRPVIGESHRKAVSIRIEENVLDRLKSKAKQKGVAYQNLINDILKKAVWIANHGENNVSIDLLIKLASVLAGKPVVKLAA